MPWSSWHSLYRNQPRVYKGRLEPGFNAYISLGTRLTLTCTARSVSLNSSSHCAVPRENRGSISLSLAISVSPQIFPLQIRRRLHENGSSAAKSSSIIANSIRVSKTPELMFFISSNGGTSRDRKTNQHP
jgi:hypothetical protein